MAEASYLLDVLALLLAAVVVVPLFQRLGIPAVLGYLAAGLALGPYTPGMVIDVEATRPLSELGVVFLLFAIGLELPLSRLKTMRRFIFGLGVAQVVVTAVVLGGLAFAVGLSAEAALVVGATLAFSSTAAVLTILVERNEVVSHHGRIAVAVLIFQDLAVVLVLALLPLLAGGPKPLLAAVAIATVKAVVAIAAIYGIGRLVIRPLYRYISFATNPEVFTAANILLVLAVGGITAAAGMSMPLGAFLAGLLLADSPYRHQVEADIEPFRGLLLGLFFMTVGVSINVPFVADNAMTVLGLTAGLLAVKAVVLFALCRVLGLGMANGLEVGLLLAQGGEFAFVVFARAEHLDIIGTPQLHALIATVALSMAATPALAALGRFLSGRVRDRDGHVMLPTGGDELDGHIIIAGYGRVGRAIARIMEMHGISYVALDLDTDRVTRLRARGLPVYYGDASQVSVLRSVRVDRARAAVVTVNRPRTAERTVTCIRQVAPRLTIIARAHDFVQQNVLKTAGASLVVPETIEASLHMAGLLLHASGLSPEAVDRSLQEHRADQYSVIAAAVKAERGDGPDAREPK